MAVGEQLVAAPHTGVPTGHKHAQAGAHRQDWASVAGASGPAVLIARARTSRAQWVLGKAQTGEADTGVTQMDGVGVGVGVGGPAMCVACKGVYSRSCYYSSWSTSMH